LLCPSLAPEDAVEFVVELGRGIQRALERDHGRDLASAGLLAQEEQDLLRGPDLAAVGRLVDQVRMNATSPAEYLAPGGSPASDPRRTLRSSGAAWKPGTATRPDPRRG
jgi:hypothetical protein